jgi:DNA polymerase-3 subunit gamma/tau
MSYIVFARKYRPQVFDQVVGQTHVTRTLANAIGADRVAHAILLSGPRGTGKTTIARIMAKAMNCAEGPTSEPCNRCQSCKEITNGHAADVFEVDGASNNSVEQVRELRENLKYLPVHSRFKIYIIDEVHMLSLAAFNALLKTLEEPPPHIMFMFATTESHKIPITILSRCQRHDLRRIDAQAIGMQLTQICDKEQARIDEEGLALIAKEAAGSMRDGLSLLDHILSCTQGPVTTQRISELLGVVERKHLFDFSGAVFARDIQAVLEKIDAAWRHGYEIKRFYGDLVAHFHQLSVVKIGPQADQLVDLPQHEIDQMKTQVADVPQSYLLQIFDQLFQAEPSIKLSSHPKLALEMIFLKLFQTAPALPIDALIKKIDQLRSDMPKNSLRHEQPQLIDRPSAMPVSNDPASSAVGGISQEENSSRPKAAQTPNAMDIDAVWQKVQSEIAEKKPSLAAHLQNCAPLSMVDGRLKLEVKGNAFTLKNIKKQLTILEQVCSRATGNDMHIKLVENIEDAQSKNQLKKKTGRLKQDALSHPLVMEALEVFDGRVIDIKIEDPKK